MNEINLDHVHLEWAKDILKRIQKILNDDSCSDEQKIDTTKWLVKQALKIERED